MFSWNSLAFSVIQWMLAIWSLVPVPFLNLACISESSWLQYWRIQKQQKNQEEWESKEAGRGEPTHAPFIHHGLLSQGWAEGVGRLKLSKQLTLLYQTGLKFQHLKTQKYLLIPDSHIKVMDLPRIPKRENSFISQLQQRIALLSACSCLTDSYINYPALL